jgi:hypothetical protein
MVAGMTNRLLTIPADRNLRAVLEPEEGAEKVCLVYGPALQAAQKSPRVAFSD